MLWGCAGPQRTHPAPNFPLSLFPFFSPTIKSDPEMVFGSRLCCAGFSPGQGWLRSLLLPKDTLPLTQPTSLFLCSSSSKKNQILKSSRRVPALSSGGNGKDCHIPAEENPCQAGSAPACLLPPRAPGHPGIAALGFCIWVHTGREQEQLTGGTLLPDLGFLLEITMPGFP